MEKILGCNPLGRWSLPHQSTTYISIPKGGENKGSHHMVVWKSNGIIVVTHMMNFKCFIQQP